MPSLHFGYALIVGVAVAALHGIPPSGSLGGVYPVVMLFGIVATGNHFLFDAVAGALTVGIAAAANGG